MIKENKVKILVGIPLILSAYLAFTLIEKPEIKSAVVDSKVETNAATGTLDFLEPLHDFGEFNEGETVKHRFEFMNIGTQTVNITGVRASCGCTTPQYSKDPIPANGSGFIDVEYNSVGRPGAFDKKIFVENNGSPSMIVLTVKGSARPAPLTGKDLSTQGGLLFSEGVVDIGNWKKDDVFRHVVKVQNLSDAPIKITSHVADGDVKVSYPPYSIMSGEKVSVAVLFSPSARKSGKVTSKIVLKTNDKNQPEKVIQLRGSLSGSEKSLLFSPQIQFEKTFIDLGDVLQHESVPVHFAFTNTGKGDLEITHVEPSCGCTVVSDLKGLYRRGDADTLKAQLDTEDKFGIIRKEILVKTNDKANPEIQLVIEANVIEHPDKVIMAEMRAKAGKSASIFEGECRTCHVDRGVDKFGKELYAASCQMCHGPAGIEDGKQHPGTIFSTQWLTAMPAEILKERIAEGTPDPKKKGMMPGFQTEFGGPLTKDQVSSLVAYMKDIPKKLN